MEKIAVACAIIGVTYFTLNYGQFPWISFILAFTFSFYGMIKKKANLPSIEGLTLESLLISPLAIIYLCYITKNNNSLLIFSFKDYFLLIMSGIVTAVPLILFGYAVKKISYSTMGFIQYIGPTLMLISGIFIFHEKFTISHIVCFGFIWLGIFIFIFNYLKVSKKVKE